LDGALNNRSDSGSGRSERARLRDLAFAAMRQRGLDPSFPPAALAQADALKASPQTTEESVRDLRDLLWCSIDNDDSRDLDQLSVAMPVDARGRSADRVRVLVAIADVDAGVAKGSPIDQHAALNTVSVYTAAVIFPMLPEKLSTDLTSLADQQDRLAVVIECVVSPDGTLESSNLYGARVRNHAKLAYNSVGAWLAGTGPLPPAAAAVAGMDEQLKLQDRIAQALATQRHEHGALEFSTIEVRTTFDGDRVRDLTPELPNRAKQLIENLMIAANGATARFLEAHGFASIRRVVRTPKHWDRIVRLAAESGDRLPSEPDSRALQAFLAKRRATDPDRFPDLSQNVIKMLGSGEYVLDPPGGDPPGHFGLAVKDYTHSTAPNRRYPDLLTQRLVKAALAGHRPPYSPSELAQLAAHCTQQEDNADKVERQIRKSAAALVVSSRIGEEFDAIVTGALPKGTFVRVFAPPIEGMLVRGQQRLEVGDRLRVRLTHTDVDKGFIDFERA
jgi:VacB/RNase II family 3'-5' exoribonuclease